MKKLLSYVYRQEWSVAIGVLAAVALEVDNQFKTNGSVPDWRSAIPIVAAAIIRQNVSSLATTQKKD